MTMMHKGIIMNDVLLEERDLNEQSTNLWIGDEDPENTMDENEA